MDRFIKERDALKKKITDMETQLEKFQDLAETKEKTSYMEGLINELLANIEVVYCLSYLYLRKNLKSNKV